MALKEIVCLALFLACASAGGWSSCPTLFGFYPDAHDCTKFFRCSWGKPFQFSCDAGTRWSQRLLTCEHEAKVPCGKYPASHQVYHAIPVYPDHTGYYVAPYHALPYAHAVNPGYYNFVKNFKPQDPNYYGKK